jgi:hypothetical protein
MDLKTYFENTKESGILATADKDGMVDAAVYARFHFLDDGTMALIMRDRLTHHNLQSESHVCCMFIEKGPGHKGKRLFLTKVREEQDSELLKSLRRRQHINTEDKSKFLAFFRVDKELSLVGAGTCFLNRLCSVQWLNLKNRIDVHGKQP